MQSLFFGHLQVPGIRTCISFGEPTIQTTPFISIILGTKSHSSLPFTELMLNIFGGFIKLKIVALEFQFLGDIW